jgi:acetyl-CoA synthetase
MKGQAVVAFVTLKQPKKPTPELREALRENVAKMIGGIAKPDDMRFAEALPTHEAAKSCAVCSKRLPAADR